MKRALSILAVILVVLAAAVAGLWWFSKPPGPDGFYTAAIPAGASPGTLLRSEPLVQGVPGGAQAWRILYVTTDSLGAPALASAVVMHGPAAQEGPRPVIAWSHGTIGVVPGCAPSLQADPFQNIPALDALLQAGWLYVGSDYTGLGTAGPHPYLAGPSQAHAQLDAVRAARGLQGLSLGRVVVWGHSQGGHAALWAGIVAPAYAPDLDIAGVAALAPATDLPLLLRRAQATAVGRILTAYVLTAYGAIYPDIDFDAEIAPGKAWFAADIAGRCLAGPRGLATALLAAAHDGTFLARDPGQGPFGARLRQNVPDGPIAAPLLVQQGTDDPLVLPAIQDGFVAARCASGQALAYRRYERRDHLSLVAPDSPAGDDLMQWTRDRLAGLAPPPGCSGDVR